MANPVIAIVEDEPDVLLLIDDLLQYAGFETILCMRGDDSYPIIRQLQPDLVILDLCLEHPAAGEQILGLLSIDPQTRDIPVIICSAYLHTLGVKADVLRAHGHTLMPKPIEPKELLATVRAKLFHHPTLNTGQPTPGSDPQLRGRDHMSP